MCPPTWLTKTYTVDTRAAADQLWCMHMGLWQDVSKSQRKLSLQKPWWPSHDSDELPVFGHQVWKACLRMLETAVSPGQADGTCAHCTRVHAGNLKIAVAAIAISVSCHMCIAAWLFVLVNKAVTADSIMAWATVSHHEVCRTERCITYGRPIVR